MLLKVLRLRSRRAARWVSVSVCLLFLLVLVGGLAPGILGSRFCWPTVLAYLTADFDGRVTSRDVSLGWFSPIVVQEVSVEDLRGQKLVQVEAVRTESSLLSLLFSSRDLGVIRIDKPDLTLVLRDDGSNLEDVLASLLAKPSSSGAVSGSIEIIDGSINLVDAQQTHVARFTSMGATVQLLAADQAQGTVTLDRCQMMVGSQSGDCAAHIEWQCGESSPNWSFSTQIHGMGLSCIEPLLRRLGENVQADGVLTTDLACQWDGSQGSVRVDVRQASAQSLRLSAPAWLGADQLQLQSLRVAGSCSVDDSRWQFEHAKVECDAGRFTIDGQFAWKPEKETSVWRQLLHSAASADLQVDGSVDLARLTQTLPGTLRMRERAAIERGTLQVQLVGKQETRQRGWLATVETSDLTAVCDGRRFTWNDPLSARLDIAYGEQGWDVRQLACHTSFLQLTGRGTPQSGSCELTCDLARLTAELHQLFDLGTLQAAGATDTQLDWQRGDDSQVTVKATSTIEHLELSTTPESDWRESRLQAALSLEAQAEGQQLTSIRTGRFELTSATDRLDLQLLEPVAHPGRDAVWSVGGAVRGEVARWLARVRPFLPGVAVDGRGSMELEFTSQISARMCDVKRLVFHSEPLRFSSSRVSVDEQTLHVELGGRWDFGGHQGSIPDALFQSSALALRATDVAWNFAGTQPQLTGDVSFAPTWRVCTHRGKSRPCRRTGVPPGRRRARYHSCSTKGAPRHAGRSTWSERNWRRTGTTATDILNVIPAATSTTWKTVWRSRRSSWRGPDNTTVHGKSPSWIDSK